MNFKSTFLIGPIFILYANSGFAACVGVDFTSINKNDQLNEMFMAAGVAGDYEFDRYQEGFAYSVCINDFEGAKGYVESGSVKLGDALKIADQLGNAAFSENLRTDFGSSSLSSTPEVAVVAANLGSPVDTGHYYRVTGVAENDVLNIRSEPSPVSQILAMFPPNAEFIEVIEATADGEWSRVNVREGTGWVRSKYLAPVYLSTFYPTNIPVGLVCASSEPYIRVQFKADGAVVGNIESKYETFPYERVDSRSGTNNFKLYVKLLNHAPEFVISEQTSGNEANQLFPYTAESSGLRYFCSMAL